MGNCMASKEKKKGKKVELTVISTWEDFQKFIGDTYKPAIVDVDNLTHPCYIQIGKDIDRTFPGNPRYK